MSYGTSTIFGTEWMVDKIKQLQPKSILDVGCGWGRWGFLAREFLDIYPGRYHPHEWRTMIAGIDINPYNQSPVHDFVYDFYQTAAVQSMAADKNAYDLVIASDVIEHMEKETALSVLKSLAHASGRLLVGIPLGPGWLRDGRPDNPYEAHLSEWDRTDLESAVNIIDRKQVTLPWIEEQGLRYGTFLACSQ